MYIVNIGRLCGILPADCHRLRGSEMASGMSSIENAWLHIEGAKIVDFGKMPAPEAAGGEAVDARGGMVLPAFCDSHTHIIYPRSREDEFVDKIRGLSYAEIARRGGGILNTADALASASEQSLYDSARQRAMQMIAMGTGAIEIKSGYGLDTAGELKMLRVAAALRESIPARVRITFLGAHAVARPYAGRQGDFVDMLIADMLPAVAAEGLAEYVDVFCDEGFFTPAETARILEAGARFGMRPKIHANELANSGGVQVGVAAGAISVDHLENAGDAEMALLGQSDTVATMLPGASFFSRLPYGPARRAIEAGATVALASDYNPGSSPSGDMRMVWALGCSQMLMLPEEGLAACTINGAAAMELTDSMGAISPGRDATFILTRPLPSLAYIPYAYTQPWISTMYIQGRPFES
ncbi:MAG: imidazolonepropionase [Muribaculaceae bacterium]|nr:imidazolonepropionase [Muribaculaceae bacterium]